MDPRRRNPMMTWPLYSMQPIIDFSLDIPSRSLLDESIGILALVRNSCSPTVPDSSTLGAAPSATRRRATRAHSNIAQLHFRFGWLINTLMR